MSPYPEVLTEEVLFRDEEEYKRGTMFLQWNSGEAGSWSGELAAGKVTSPVHQALVGNRGPPRKGRGKNLLAMTENNWS